VIFTCRDLAQRLTEVEEGPAHSVERASLRFHLSICARCRRYVAELGRLKELLTGLGQEPETAVPTGASVTHALASFRAWRAGEPSPDDD